MMASIARALTLSLVILVASTLRQAISAPSVSTPALSGYFVARDGLDRWSGQLPTPNASRTDGPFASLYAALAAMRVLPLTRQIYIRGGSYALQSPVALDEADTGAQLLAYPGEVPILLGGLPVMAWRPADNGTYTASVPPLAESELPMVLAAGRLRRVARLPAAEAGDDQEAAWFFADRSPDGADTHNSFGVRAENMEVFDSAKPGALVSIFGQRGWQNFVLPVAKADRARRLITLKGRTWDSIGEGSRFQILNAALIPGTWRLDRVSDTLQLDASNMAPGSDLVVATLPCIISVDHATDVTLAGLKLAGTSTEGVAICISHSRQIKLDRLNISDAGEGIRLDHATETTITHSEVAHTGSFGIVLRHDSDANLVRGNWLHDIGLLHQDASAIWFDASSHNVFARNRIERVAKFGIGGGSLTDGAAVENVIEGNDISEANRRTSDGGAILVIGWGQETTHDVIKDNFISGATALGNMGWDNRPATHFQDPVTKLVSEAIYLDDWASGVEVTSNLICGNIGGINLHAGWDNHVTGNFLLANAGIAFGVDAQVWLGAGQHPHAMERNVIERNVTILDRPSDGQRGAVTVRGGPNVAQFDHNVYSGPGLNGASFHHERDTVGAEYSFGIEGWHRRGQDLSSIANKPSLQVVMRGNAIEAADVGIPVQALPIQGIGRPEDQANLPGRIRERCGLR